MRPSGTPTSTDARLLAVPLLLFAWICTGTEAQEWKGAHADEAELAKFFEQEYGLSREEALRAARESIDRMRRSVEDSHPGLRDGHYDYDVNQDIVIGADGLPPNCFGDAARGGRTRWEPSKEELDKWLADQGYSKTDDCTCERGWQKVAVYEVTLRYKLTEGGEERILVQPVHIAEEQEDCRWRSRMGNLGVIMHRSPSQIWTHPDAAKILGELWCEGRGMILVGAELAHRCFTRRHGDGDYHGRHAEDD